jgi:transcriptional regulator with XRE-family HTH domain
MGSFSTASQTGGGSMTWQLALGQQIKEARLKAGLSQVDLAKAIGRSRKMIPRYEDGSDAVSPDLLAKIAVTLGMTKVDVNGYRFSIEHRTDPETVETTEQLTLDFNKEHVFQGGLIKITATKMSITITASAPSPPLQPAA